MAEHSILVTGDYWHTDFQSLVSKLQVPVTLVPIGKAESVKDFNFDLVVVAQARRDQFSMAEIEKLQSLFANLPIVALLGSWCEGELRSGTPWPGVIRVYWHQWEGRYERFVKQLSGAGITDWHAPRTSAVADRIASGSGHDRSISGHPGKIAFIAISAWTHWQHEMVADAVRHFGWPSRWVERAVWDGASSVLVSAICVDADSWSFDLKNRLKWIQEGNPRFADCFAPELSPTRRTGVDSTGRSYRSRVQAL